MQPLRPAPTGHRAPRELVDDDDLAVLDDVIDIALEQVVGAQRGIEVVQQDDVRGAVETVALVEQAGVAQQFLDVLVSLLGQVDLLDLLVDREITRAVLFELWLERRDDLVDATVEFGVVVGRPRDDQRRPRLVDQDRIDLVDDGEVEPALDPVLLVEGHVVSQVVEAEFVVRAIGDVGRIGLALGQCILPRQDDTGLHAEKVVDLPHPVGITLGQIVVDGHDMDPLAGQGPEVDGQGRDEGLAFTGPHLGDAALVQDHAADELDVVVSHAEDATRGLAYDGKGLVHEPVERLASGEAFPEALGLRPELLVAHGLEPFLEGVDTRHIATHLLDQPLVPATEHLA